MNDEYDEEQEKRIDAADAVSDDVDEDVAGGDDDGDMASTDDADEDVDVENIDGADEVEDNIEDEVEDNVDGDTDEDNNSQDAESLKVEDGEIPQLEVPVERKEGYQNQDNDNIQNDPVQQDINEMHNDQMGQENTVADLQEVANQEAPEVNLDEVNNADAGAVADPVVLGPVVTDKIPDEESPNAEIVQNKAETGQQNLEAEKDNADVDEQNVEADRQNDIADQQLLEVDQQDVVAHVDAAIVGDPNVLGPVVTDKVFMVFTVNGIDAGRVEIGLFGQIVPLTVANFKGLCEGFKNPNGQLVTYKGSSLHRIVKNFILQGGDLSKTVPGEQSIYGGPFKDENFTLKHNGAGWLNMANRGTDTNTSHFCFMFVAAPQLDGKCVVFGKVLSGMKVLRYLESLPVNVETPTDNVVIADCGLIEVPAPFAVDFNPSDENV